MEVTRFGQFLVNNDIISDTVLLQALVEQNKRQETIERIAVAKRILSVKQMLATLNRQADSCDSFTAVALRMGYLTDDEVDVLVELQQQSRPMLGEILVEMGALDRKTLEIMLDKFHSLSLQYGYSETG